MENATPKRRSAHDKINDIREALGMERDDTVDPDVVIKEREARHKRYLKAGTEENYVKLYNRNPITDEWLGPGPDPGTPLEFLDLTPEEQEELDKINKQDWEDKYIKKDVPRYVLPVEKETKAIKKARKERIKAEEQAARQEKYDIAYWALNSFFIPEESERIRREYVGRMEEMVDFLYEYVTEWAKYCTWTPGDGSRDIPIEEISRRMEVRQIEESEVVLDVDGMKFKRLEVAERKKRYYEVDLYTNSFPDIPDEYWDEFDKWADKHPIKEFKKKAKKMGWGISAMGVRRATFLKKINKRNKKFRKNMLLHDPITGMSFVSEKKMKEHMEKQMKIYDKRRKEFAALLDEMVAKNEISEDLAIDWLGDSEEARERIKKRQKHEMEVARRAQKRKKEFEAQERHEKKVQEERAKWYKKFGGDINEPLKFCWDNEEITVEKISKPNAVRPVYKIQRGELGGNKTVCTENLANCMW